MAIKAIIPRMNKARNRRENRIIFLSSSVCCFFLINHMTRLIKTATKKLAHISHFSKEIHSAIMPNIKTAIIFTNHRQNIAFPTVSKRVEDIPAFSVRYAFIPMNMHPNNGNANVDKYITFKYISAQ